MKYFILTEDRRYTYPMFDGWHGILDSKTMEMKKNQGIPRHLVYCVDGHMQMVFADILLFPCFMVSGVVRDVICLYEPSIRYRRVVLMDRRQKKSKAYYVPFLEETDCVVDKSFKFGEKGSRDPIKLDGKKINGKALVKLSYRNSKRIAVSLDLIESILRRKTVGIGAEEAVVVD